MPKIKKKIDEKILTKFLKLGTDLFDGIDVYTSKDKKIVKAITFSNDRKYLKRLLEIQ